MTEVARAQAPEDSSDNVGAKNMQQLILLRWIAVFGQLLAIGVVQYMFGIDLPLQSMLLVVSGLVVFNLLSLLYWRRRTSVGDPAMLFALLVDVASLTVQLHLSGGVTNPFVFLYLLQVGLGAVVLKPASGWMLIAATSVCLAGLMVFHGPIAIPIHPADGLVDHYLQGLLVCFVLNATLLVVFVTRIGRILRARDARLAALRQRAAEEEHIVRMGLLASGAAHELGTPLSTIAVILSDWQRLPQFISDPELLNDVLEMQSQVGRCKSIVTGILLSAGQTRGDAPAETTMHAFLDGLVDEWRETRPIRDFDYRNRFGEDIEIVSDWGLKQMIGNVLDNALEASPGWLSLEASREGDDLVLRVADIGPGFSEAMLAHLGQPYRSSKGRTGGGLGLFLSLNVARTLGGALTARNRPERGALVTMTLPLATLTLSDPADDH